MFILKKGHQPGVYVPLRALFLVFFKINFLKILSWIPSECQTVWTLIRPDYLSGLIWVQTGCLGYQQTTLVDKELMFDNWGTYQGCHSQGKKSGK